MFREGQACRIALLTDGAHSNPNSRAFPPGRVAALRRAELENAVQALGGGPGDILRLDMQDGRAAHPGEDGFEGALDRLVAIAREIQATSVFATWDEDPHSDHKAAAALAAALALRMRLRHFSYPVWAWTRPATDCIDAARLIPRRLDIETARSAKEAAIACHGTQLGGVIHDDPTRLPPEFLAFFRQPWEVFLEHLA